MSINSSPVRFLIIIVIVTITLSCQMTARVGAMTYELDGRVTVEGPGWNLRRSAAPKGEVPALSPDGNSVAFLHNGNVYILSNKGHAIKQVTHNPTVVEADTLLPLRITWHPSGKIIAYTRTQRYRYDSMAKILLLVDNHPADSEMNVNISTIWLVNLVTYKQYKAIGPLGDYSKLRSTDQLQGAGVYEPMFSPDGQELWFLNAGHLYKASITENDGKVHTYSLVARLGTGLDFCSPGASKWGKGAKELAWDIKRKRLVFWIGRFWGSGESEYGYMILSGKKLGKPISWNPSFSEQIRNNGSNADECAIDKQGNLWVNADIGAGNYRWVRQDSRIMLPVGAGRPSF